MRVCCAVVLCEMVAELVVSQGDLKTSPSSSYLFLEKAICVSIRNVHHLDARGMVGMARAYGDCGLRCCVTTVEANRLLDWEGFSRE